MSSARWLRGTDMRRRSPAMPRDEAGFTLAELLIACALIGVVMSGLYALLTSGQQMYLTGTNQMGAQQTLRLAVQRITTEVRDGGYCPTCGTGSPAITPFSAITSANATGFTIQNDRSEEHTSELQSPYDLVCRLLLEKKK